MAEQNREATIVQTGSAFALGLVTGLFLKEAAKQLYGRIRAGQWHREYERTVEYDENLPEQLGRREPAPHPGQPRYGGTGAMGVSPAAAATPRSGD